MNFTNLTSMPQIGIDETGQGCPHLWEHTNGWKYSFAGSFALIVFLAVVGNILVICTICRNPKKFRTIVHIFIANMAMSDIVGAIFIAPIRISNALDVPFPLKGTLGAIMCPLSPFLSDSSFVVSVLTIIIIAAERFQAVVFPRRHLLPFTQYRCLSIFTIWFIAFAFYSPYFYTKRLVSEDDEILCDTKWEPAFDPDISPRVYFVVDVILFWAIPAILLVGMYGVVLIYLKRQGDNFRSMVSLERQRVRQIRDQNISAMLITVTVAFYVTWSPFITFYLLVMFLPRALEIILCHYNTLEFVFSLMATSNSAINPFIYFILNKTYRCGMLQLLSIVCSFHKIC